MENNRNDKIRISVIMPAYNAAATLEKAIKSVLYQTLDAIELIIVNDGSTDKTQEICDFYSKKYNWVKTFEIENSGVGHARNFGIEKANGEFIAFVDADDWIHSEMYQTLYDELFQYNADIIMCGYIREFHKTLHQKSRKRNRTISCKSCSIVNSIDFYQHFNELYKKNYIHVLWNKLYKKAIIQKYKIKMNTNITKGEDLLFNLKYLLKTTNIKICHHSFYHYVNKEQTSLSNRIDRNDFNINKLLYQSVTKFLIKKCNITSNEANADIYLRGCFLIMERSMQMNNTEYFDLLLKTITSDHDTRKAILESSPKKIESILYRIALISKKKQAICMVIHLRIQLKKIFR